MLLVLKLRLAQIKACIQGVRKIVFLQNVLKWFEITASPSFGKTKFDAVVSTFFVLDYVSNVDKCENRVAMFIIHLV